MNQNLRGRMNVGAAFLLSAVVISVSVGTSQAALPDYFRTPNSLVVEFDWESTDWTLKGFTPEDSIYDLYDLDPSASVDGIDTHVVLPNFVDDLGLKKMRIILAFVEPVDYTLIDIQVEGHDPLGAVAQPVFSAEYIPTVYFFDWEIRPNPDWEDIWIFGNEAANIVPGNLNFIEIVTVTIPEPGTFALTTLGLLTMCCRRRRLA
jgi:hypothetical protein